MVLLTMTFLAGLAVMSLSARRFDTKAGASAQRQAFEEGRAFAHQGSTLTTSCNSRQGQLHIICLEGFFYQDAADRFTKSKMPLAAATDSRTWIRELPGYRYPLWAIGLGFAVAKGGYPPRDFKTLFFDDILWSYFIDGWALMTVEARGPDGARAACEQGFTAPDEQEACLWGVGRGIFFYADRAAATKKETEAGYLFAADFSTEKLRPLTDFVSLPSSPEKSSQVIKRQIFGQPIEPAELRPLDECLRAHHVSRCSRD